MSASCVVPVDVPRPDPVDEPHPDSADSGLEGGFDAGVDAELDAGMHVAPCSVPQELGPFLARSTSQFRFPGCATARFSSEPGVSVVTQPHTDGSATVMITPSQVGVWILTIDADGMRETRNLRTGAAYDVDAGFVVRYPDRKDLFLLRTVSPSGRLLVAQSPALGNRGEFEVYGRDGGLEQILRGDVDRFAWAGSTLWVLRAGSTDFDRTFERWVETPSGLISEGTLDVSTALRPTCVFCRVAENQLETMIGSDLVRFTWDAGVSSRQVLNQGFDVPPQPDDMVIPEGSDILWGSDFCSYERGCSTTVCPAIRECVYRVPWAARIIRVDDAQAIVVTEDSFELWELPLSNRRRLDSIPRFMSVAPGSSPSSKEPMVFGFSDTFELFVHRNRLGTLRYPGSPDTYVITNRWLMRRLSPREAQFVPR